MDYNKMAFIKIHREVVDPLGHYIDTYKWEGSRNWPVIVSDRLVGFRDDVFDKLPWKFIKIEYQPEHMGWLCIRKDVLFPFGWLVIVKDKTNNILFDIKCRVIYTFQIWGIGYTPNYETPVWSNLWRKRL
jgi:hypothetical protein